MEVREGAFKLQARTRIQVDAPAQDTGRFLAERLGEGTGYKLKVETSNKAEAVRGAILLTTKGAKLGLIFLDVSRAVDQIKKVL